MFTKSAGRRIDQENERKGRAYPCDYRGKFTKTVWSQLERRISIFFN